MASQQAWDDFDSVRRLVDVVNAQKNGPLRGSLHELNTLFTAIAADPARAAEVSALADSHPTETAAHLAEEAGKLLAMRAWLIANGYILG
jgi:hypothetical protein